VRTVCNDYVGYEFNNEDKIETSIGFYILDWLVSIEGSAPAGKNFSAGKRLGAIPFSQESGDGSNG